MTPDEQDQVARIRSKLYDFVSSNPDHADAEQARRILGKLPAHAAQEAMSPQPRELTDEEAGVEHDPETSRLMTLTGRPDSPAVAAMGPRKWHPTTELEGDPGAQMIVQQAELSPLMRMLGMGVSATGRALEGTAGGRAAKVIAEKGADAMVNEPSAEAESQLAHIRQMRTAAPERAPMLDRQEESILENSIKPDPEVEAARETLRFKGPHGGDLGTGGAAYLLGHFGGHGSLGLGAAGLPLLLRNASPIAGRIATPMANVGARLAPDLVPPSSLLLDMAMGKDK